MDKEIQPIIGRDTKELIAITAHDLRSVISSIHGLNLILKEKLAGHADVEFQELTGLISSQCEFGLNITGEMVKSYKWDIISLNNLLVKHTRLYKYQAEGKNITLNIELAEKDIYVQTEADLLTRLLDNLFDNAMKFTPRRGSIKIALQQQDNKAVISVTDTGIGIPEKYQLLLFDRQADVQRVGTENEPSTGLGLYISQQLIKELNGELRFESKEYLGTTFYISLDVHHSNPTD